MMTASRLAALAMLLALTTAPGCAAEGGTPGRSLSSPHTITPAEIRASTATTALELVQTLRPAWLRTRTVSFVDRGEVVVYLGPIRLGGAAALRDQEVTGLTLLEFVDPGTATQRWGTGHAGGAIVLHR
jgi:hypothetical protein